MKAILNRRTIIIVSTAMLLAIISIVSVNVFNTSGPVTGFAGTITQPIRSLATTVARTFGSIFSAIYAYDELAIENDQLKTRIAEMEADYRESQELRAENERLRALMSFDATRHGGYDREMANITSRGGDNWSSTFVINKGYANSSIEKGMGVITEFGALVGQVYDVGATSSTVITVLDTKFSAAAYVGRTDTDDDDADLNAVAKGDFTYMNNGMLVLDQIDERIIVRKNDYVMTSGRGGIFPPALVIGEVEDVMRHTSGIGRFAPIKPMANLDTVEIVFVITGFDMESDIG